MYTVSLEFLGAITIAVDEVPSSWLTMKSVTGFSFLAFTGVNELQDPGSRLILFYCFCFPSQRAIRSLNLSLIVY